jgi:hypothetical protein
MKYTALASNYNKCPYIAVSSGENACSSGWEQICSVIQKALTHSHKPRFIINIECYIGVHEEEITSQLQSFFPKASFYFSKEVYYSEDLIEQKVQGFLGAQDPIFGYITNLRLPDFLDPVKVESIRKKISSDPSNTIFVLGTGANLMTKGDLLIYADLARWESQMRMRANTFHNLGVSNHALKWSLQYKRAYFIDWRVCDMYKRECFPSSDYILDTNKPDQPKMAKGQDVLRGLKEASQQPFRVVPFFDPAPWGGQWMREVCDLDNKPENFGWCFDCVPEENSLLLNFGGTLMELPSINVVFFQPKNLLGDKVHARFGDEFPIRFDFLDTMGGGHLSLQVHPLTEFIQQNFGLNYTQDESYYILDAGEGACVYLGLKDGIEPSEMIADLKKAQTVNQKFDDEKYINCFPAKKHDHFLIPAGTIHCSGNEAMVLEISATPYIFTFKLWDWGRLGLDGLPRPINIDRGSKNIQWERTTKWVQEQLINCIENIDAGQGWREERTGLHEREFIETRRHWFTSKVEHDTNGGVNVINLIEGREAIVESPNNLFKPFVVHYAETFIIPASVGCYTIRPYGESEGKECATLKAFVRT